MKTWPLLFVFLLSAAASKIEATPSTLFWTNATTEVQATGTAAINSNNFFTVFNNRGKHSSLPPDVGVTLGIFTWHDIKAEAGIDYLGGTDYPLFFNAKLGVGANKLFANAPSFSVGIFNAGTKAGVTNQNVVDFVFGFPLPLFSSDSKFYVGGFAGSKSIGPERQGAWAGINCPFSPAKDCEGKDYHKWEFSADYASGNNIIGGGGFAFTYYFTPAISLQSGPAWFNDAKLNGQWKWSVQVTINIPVFKP